MKLAWREHGRNAPIVSPLFDCGEEAGEWLAENPPADDRGRTLIRVYRNGDRGRVDPREFVDAIHRCGPELVSNRRHLEVLR